MRTTWMISKRRFDYLTILQFGTGLSAGSEKSKTADTIAVRRLARPQMQHVTNGTGVRSNLDDARSALLSSHPSVDTLQSVVRSVRG